MKKKIIVGIYGLAILMQSIFAPFNFIVHNEQTTTIYRYFWFEVARGESKYQTSINYQRLCFQLIITTVLFGCVYFIFKPRGNNKKTSD